MIQEELEEPQGTTGEADGHKPGADPATDCTCNSSASWGVGCATTAPANIYEVHRGGGQAVKVLLHCNSSAVRGLGCIDNTPRIRALQF